MLRARCGPQVGLLLMLLPEAVEALSALAHGHRLAVFRLLVRAGADGLRAGEIARGSAAELTGLRRSSRTSM